MRKRKEAFTLVEFIIAASILAFLLSALYLVFWRSSSAQEKGEVRIQMYQNARISLDVMSREIKTAFISQSDSHLIFKGDQDSLYYVSASHKPSRAGEYDLCEIGYSLKGSELQRRIKAVLDSKPGQGGSSTALALGILRLEFSYYDGEKWQKTWDSTRGTLDDVSDDLLPRAVKIILTAQDERAKEEPLTLFTLVHLPQR